MKKENDRLGTLGVDVAGLSLEYFTGAGGWVEILKEVDLSIDRGEVVGLVGESGCGKSTLAYNILGYRASNSRISHGRVLVGETDVTALGRKQLDSLRGRRVALVPQNPTTSLSPHLRIRAQLSEVLVEHGYATEASAVDRRLRELLRLVGLGDTDRILNSYPHELSGGQQQRLVIAMALSCDPEALVLDEPTTGLDVTTQSQIIRLLNELKHKINLAMLYVTHDLNVLAQIADRVIVMYAGRVVESGPVGSLFNSPVHPYTRGLIGSIPDIRQTARRAMRLQGVLRRSEIGPGCPFAARCAHWQAICDTIPPGIEAVADDHAVACHVWRQLPVYDAKDTVSVSKDPTRQASDVLLEVDKIAISYGKASLVERLSGKKRPPVVKDFSLTIRRGEIVSLVGESGSGKSTIAKAITGIIDHSAGTIRYRDTVLGGLTVRSSKTLGEIQYVFQNPDESLNPRRTIGSTLMRPIQHLLKPLTASERKQLVIEALRQVQLDEGYVSRYPNQLSGGERQRVAIARALVTQPQLLLCDEILSALDVSVQAKVIDVLLDLRRRGDIAMLFISHDLSVVRSISDRVVVLYKGRIMEEGPTERIYAPPYHPYTHMLLDAVPEQGRLPSMPEPAVRPSDPNPAGCVLANRCPWKKGGMCDTVAPPQRQSGELTIYCHHDLETLSELATWQEPEPAVAQVPELAQ